MSTVPDVVHPLTGIQTAKPKGAKRNKLTVRDQRLYSHLFMKKRNEDRVFAQEQEGVNPTDKVFF